MFGVNLIVCMVLWGGIVYVYIFFFKYIWFVCDKMLWVKGVKVSMENEKREYDI